MITRRSVWSDPEIQELLKQFIPAADEVWRLQHDEGPEGELFRVIAEQGHYAGRTQPTDTRQGIYAAAPSGKLLSSINNNNPRRVARMLREALANWEQLPEDERYLDREQVDAAPLDRRHEAHYPDDGMVLRVNSRDLPREDEESGDRADDHGDRRGRRAWMEHAWNMDYAWFKRREMMSFVPDELTVGATTEVPRRLVHRLAALHLVDNVRGQVGAFGDDDVKAVEMTATITGIDGEQIAIRLEGRTRAVSPGRRSDNFRHDGPEYHERGIETELLGTAKFDRALGRFTAFDLVARGTRWGGDRYNGRADDPGPAPIGFALTFAPDDPHVAPASFWRYGW